MTLLRLLKSLIGRSLVAVLLASGCLPGSPAHAGIDQLWILGEDNGHLPTNAQIVSMKDQNCVDAERDSAANGTRILIFGCRNGAYNPDAWNQRWRTNPNSNFGWCGYATDYRGVTYLEPLVCPNGSNAPGYELAWFSIAVGDNWGACIDVPGGNDANGQPLQIYECNGTPAQVWRAGYPAYGESPYWIRSNITEQGVNRCWTNWGLLVLYDCAYDF